MKTLLLLCAVILIASAAPDGYYKQEYQFKKSSSTYKNNQLETKDDDEGYYGKQGDLSGNSAPTVQQSNQHSEFVSPTVGGAGHTQTTYNDRDLTPDAERAFRNHNILPGTNRHYSQSTYSTQSNLGQMTQNLQYDMEQQLRDAIQTMKGQSAYGASQMRSEDMQYLENQLRNNITRQLQQSLYNRYGAQTTRGQSSYSTTATGGYSPTANYDTNELAQLRQQMERDLLKKLHDGARSSYSQSSSSSSSWNSYGTTNMGHQHRNSEEVDDLNTQRQVSSNSNYRPVAGNDDFQRPERLSYNQRPISGSQTNYGSSYGHSQSASGYGSSYDRNFPTLAQSQITVNPTRRVTDVLQGVQNDITQQVREALNSYQTRYSGSSYTLTNSRPEYQTALDDFKRQLRYNITKHIESELDRNYGRQDIRGDYSFSQGQQTNANYKTVDLDDLKQQIENNLINYLETSFRTYETNYQNSRSQYSNSQRDYTHQSPQYTQSLTSDIAQNPNHVRYEPNQRSWSSSSSWSSQSSYGSGAGTSGNTQQPLNSQLEQIRSQLQQDLSRQLQTAVYDQKSHSSYNTQSNSQVEQLLSNELKSNLTRRLQETLNEHYGNQGVRGGQSYTISTSGMYSPTANYRTEDLSRLRQQLQDDLVRNLQEQLRSQSQSQYSASSGGYNSGYNSGYSSGSMVGHVAEGQDTDDMGQQTIDDTFNPNDDDLVQKTLNSQEFEDLQVDSQTKPIRGDIGQVNAQFTSKNKTESMVGQTVDDDFGQFELGSQAQRKPILVGQQTEDLENAELTDNFQKPKTDDTYGPITLGSQSTNYGTPQFGSQRQPVMVGQQVEDLGQQIEDIGMFEHSDNYQKPIDDDDFGQIELGSNKPKNNPHVGNQYGPHSVVSHQQTESLGQQTEELGQETDDVGQQTIDVHPEPSNPQVNNNQESDYDDIILGVKPLDQSSTTPKPSITPYISRNRYYPRIPQGSSSYVLPAYPTTTQKMTVYSQQEEIERFAEQLAEAQGTQDGFNDQFIDHGDYLQHKPQSNDFSLPGTVHDDDLTQQPQEENFDTIFQNPENNGAPPAMSLSDLNRAYTSQNQYAGAQRFNPYQTSQSRRMPVDDDFQIPVIDDELVAPTMPPVTIPMGHYITRTPMAPNRQIRPVFDDTQQHIEPEFETIPQVPSYQQNVYNSYAKPNQDTQQEISPQVPQNIPDPEEKYTSSEGIEEEEAVTEVVKPLGFWAKVGGKITSGFNTVKQKAKSLVGSD